MIQAVTEVRGGCAVVMLCRAMPITAILHVQMILFVVLVILGIVALGVWGRRADRVPGTSKVVGAAVLGVWLLYNVYYFHPAIFRWDTSLPLHVCDMLGLLSAIALIVPKRFARAVLYFTAIPLAGQAILTPAGNQDPATLRFWLYWTLHAGILGASVYDLVIRRYVPAIRDYVAVLCVDVVYVLVIVPIDILFGWNYGYLGDAKPDAPTAIDVLGPWPQRVFLIFFIVIIIQAIMLIPWRVVRRQRLRMAPNEDVQ
jgi:hypothetical integral membrane protein (TIGR02206 family)